MSASFTISFAFAPGTTREQAEEAGKALAGHLQAACGGVGIEVTFEENVDELPNASRQSRLPRFATLTTRERQILKLLAEGNTVQEIARDLFLSIKTVEAHKFNFMRKLDIHNRAQVVRYAIQQKIIKIPNLI